MTSVNALLWDREMDSKPEPPERDEFDELCDAAKAYVAALHAPDYTMRKAVDACRRLERAAIAYANAQEDEE